MEPRVAEVLTDLRRGSPGAQDLLYRLVYDELRRIAGREMGRETPQHTLTPTALVHEAYLRLLGHVEWRDRSHFLAAAARAMRNILVDHARARGAQRRGGGRARVTLDENAHAGSRPWEEMLDVHEALERFQHLDAEGARVVELRFFGGLEFAQIARAIDRSEATVYRIWNHARAWLYREIRS